MTDLPNHHFTMMIPDKQTSPVMSAPDIFKFGIAGLGGHAALIRQCIEKNPLRPSRTCHPSGCMPSANLFQNQHAALISELKARDVEVYADIDELLDSDIEAVWLPVPIDLQRPFTEKSLARDKAVMCEKPAAGCVEDLDAMIAARDRSGLPMAIGFQHIDDPIILEFT